MDLVNNPELLRQMHRLADVGDDPRHTLDMFLTGTSDVKLRPVNRTPFAADLETKLQDRSRRIHNTLIASGSYDSTQVLIDPHNIRLQAGVAKLPQFSAPYNWTRAKRELQKEGALTPDELAALSHEIAIGSFGMVFLNYLGKEWLLYGVRAKWTEDIGGPLQFIAVGSCKAPDLKLHHPLLSRLHAEYKEETGFDPTKITEEIFMGIDGSAGYWRDGQATWRLKTNETPISDAQRQVNVCRLDEIAELKPYSISSRDVEVLYLGQRSPEHSLVFGIPTDQIGTFFALALRRMASYTRPNTARLLIERLVS